mmetsp:Transcript_1418/g.4129  ORF Transcript_1418/g.4129 Transcript_1418/m.4129 type:complete len:224 (+) Transcript_1418:344-1015(+)
MARDPVRCSWSRHPAPASPAAAPRRAAAAARMLAAEEPPAACSVWDTLIPGVTSGFEERRRVRLTHMYLPHEPLPQEALGAALLLGTFGARVGGLLGLLLGALNLAPCAVHAPGPGGEAFRIAGYHTFTAAVRGTERAGAVWNEAASSQVAAWFAALLLAARRAACTAGGLAWSAAWRAALLPASLASLAASRRPVEPATLVLVPDKAWARSTGYGRLRWGGW